jgi:lysozyme
LNTYIIKGLQFEEGYSETAYFDTLGYPTIGTGHRIGPKGAVLSDYQFKISKAVDAVWLNEEVEALEKTLSEKYVWFPQLNEARQFVVISMCYQLGMSGFAGFSETIKLIASGCYAKAASEMMDSAWASDKQTPNRARREAKVMSTGDFCSVTEYAGL